MSQTERDTARERFSRWNALPPDERHALRSRWQRFQALPPEQQAAVRQNFHRFQQLPAERRQMLREQWNRASPAERKEMAQRARDKKNDRRNPGTRRMNPPFARPPH
jgi:TRAP-type C4-dicarboxylate transport system substrate-binding protein